jgi:hypothetical protein
MSYNTAELADFASGNGTTYRLLQNARLIDGLCMRMTVSTQKRKREKKSKQHAQNI